MAAGDRLAFYRTNVTFTPTGGSLAAIKTTSLTLNEEVATVDVTTTEDNGYAFQLATLSTISGTLNLFQREDQNVPIVARQTGALAWNINTTNTALGNYSLDVQITSVNRGEANVQGAIPVAISFVGQGGWKSGSFGR
jgi:hypothetical protein